VEQRECGTKKKILVLAPFFGPDDTWIDGFCTRPDLEFKRARYLDRPTSWHQRGATTPLREWVSYFSYARKSMQSRSDCIITCFPQLALATAALLSFTDNPGPRLIAWHFNLGSLSNEWKGYLAGRVLRRVDRFVVHSRSEITNYAKWLGIGEQKFCFVPLQRGSFDEVKPSQIQRPYIVSMGSANRDYKTLVNAVLGTGIKTVVISKKNIIDDLPEHPDLLKLNNLTYEECKSILSGAELNIVPISAADSASGQVTFITSMTMGIPTVATRCISTVDYIQDGNTGILVPPGDPGALRQAIESLWQDKELRLRIGLAGRHQAQDHFSDEAAGRNLAQIIDEVLA
jgi:glycosyltransferase involved in cell wall biosynthesis